MTYEDKRVSVINTSALNKQETVAWKSHHP